MNVYTKYINLCLFLVLNLGQVKADQTSQENIVNSQDPTAPAITTQSKALGFYVWQAESFLTPVPENDIFWEQFKLNKVNHLLISLTTDQINKLSSPPGYRKMNKMIAIANKKGIKTDLLLGEPNWILPAYRNNLVNIVKQLKANNFAGINLDLEPNQLAGYKTDYLLRELNKTLKEVKRVSPWPIALTIKYSYMNEMVGSKDFATRLEKTGIAEATLMMYCTSTKRIIDVISPIIEAHPKLKFSIAQSIENPSVVSEISEGESHYTEGVLGFHQHMGELEMGIQYANFNGIIVQDWSNYAAIQGQTAQKLTLSR